jgi:hypothetical protein
MNDEKLARMLIALAAAAVLNADFDEFVELVRADSSDDIQRRYRRIKGAISEVRRQGGLPSQTATGIVSPTASALRETTRLLSAIGVSNREGAEEIARQLQKLGLVREAGSVAYNPKESFGRWFRRVSTLAGAANVLRAATLVAADRSGKPQPDWKLADERDR